MTIWGCGITGLVRGSCIPMMLSGGAAVNPEKTGFTIKRMNPYKKT